MAPKKNALRARDPNQPVISGFLSKSKCKLDSAAPLAKGADLDKSRVSKTQRTESSTQKEPTALHQSSKTVAGGKDDANSKRQLPSSDPIVTEEDVSPPSLGQVQDQVLESLAESPISLAVPADSGVPDAPLGDSNGNSNGDLQSLDGEEDGEEGEDHLSLEDRDGKYWKPYMEPDEMHQEHKTDPIFLSDKTASECLGYTVAELKASLKARREQEKLPKSAFQREIGRTTFLQPKASPTKLDCFDDLFRIGMSYLYNSCKKGTTDSCVKLTKLLDQEHDEIAKILKSAFTDLGMSLCLAIINGTFESELEKLLKSADGTWSSSYNHNGGIYLGAGFNILYGLLSYIGKSNHVLRRIGEHEGGIGKEPFSPDRERKLFYKASQIFIRDGGKVDFFKLMDLPVENERDSMILTLAETLWCFFTQSYVLCNLWLEKRAQYGLAPISILGTNMDTCLSSFFSMMCHNGETLEANESMAVITMQMALLRFDLGKARATIRLIKLHTPEEVATAREDEVYLVKKREELRASYYNEMKDLMDKGEFTGCIKVLTDERYANISNFFTIVVDLKVLAKLFPGAIFQKNQRYKVKITLEYSEKPNIDTDYFLALNPYEKILFGGVGIKLTSETASCFIQHYYLINENEKSMRVAKFLSMAIKNTMDRLTRAQPFAPPELPRGTSGVVKRLLRGEMKTNSTFQSGGWYYYFEDRFNGSNERSRWMVPACPSLISDIPKGQPSIPFRLVFNSNYKIFGNRLATTTEESEMLPVAGLEYGSFEGKWKPITMAKLREENSGMIFAALEAFQLAKDLKLPISTSSDLETSHPAVVPEPEDVPGEPEWFRKRQHGLRAGSEGMMFARVTAPLIKNPLRKWGFVDWGIPKEAGLLWFPGGNKSPEMASAKFWLKFDFFNKNEDEMRIYTCRITPGPFQGKWLDLNQLYFRGGANLKIKKRAKIPESLWKIACHFNKVNPALRKSKIAETSVSESDDTDNEAGPSGSSK